MYNIYNKSQAIFVYDFKTKKTELIGNEEELIKLIAKEYHYILGSNEIANSYLEDFICSEGDIKPTTRWWFFDGEKRTINPKNYEQEAYSLYLNKYKDKEKFEDYRYWRKNKTYKGIFRKTPVSNLATRRGGPYEKKPFHFFKRIYAPFCNPEYKGFNRKGRPDLWWDVKDRCVERNWKSQRKHQYKE